VRPFSSNNVFLLLFLLVWSGLHCKNFVIFFFFFGSGVGTALSLYRPIFFV